MIPEFQTFMLPLLQWTSDGNEHSLSEARQYLWTYFKLSEQELQELLPSGTQPVFANRVAWSKVFLNKAGLLASTKRGYFKITERWQEVLKENLDKITAKYLLKFDEFKEFQQKKSDKKNQETENEWEINEVTPEERIALGYNEIKTALISELLDKIKSCSPAFFERLVVDLLVKMGYGGNRNDAWKAIGRSGDGGVDGIIKEDKLGLDVIYLQAKRYTENSVQRPEIQKFVWALASKWASKGVFITTSTFSSGARECSTGNYRLILIDWEELANLMIEYNVWVSVKNTYEIKWIDNDYYEE